MGCLHSLSSKWEALRSHSADHSEWDQMASTQPHTRAGPGNSFRALVRTDEVFFNYYSEKRETKSVPLCQNTKVPSLQLILHCVSAALAAHTQNSSWLLFTFSVILSPVSRCRFHILVVWVLSFFPSSLTRPLTDTLITLMVNLSTFRLAAEG